MKVIEYTPEFEAWWITVEHLYANNVGILTEMFKEVSFRAWQARDDLAIRSVPGYGDY
jgi:hypothetical protein